MPPQGAGEAEVYRFGTFTLDAQSGELRRGGHTQNLTAQPTRALLHLLRNAGRLVTRDELIAHLWRHRVVEYDQSLNFCVRRIRAALGDNPRNPIFIETVPGRGYRFTAPVTVRAAAGRPWDRGLGLRVSGVLFALAVLGAAAVALSAPGDSPPRWAEVDEASASSAKAPTRSSDARSTFLLAGEYFERNVEIESARFAADLYERAATLDPSFVDAHALHAVARATLSWEFGLVKELAAARRALTRASRLDADAAVTHAAAGYVRYYGERDYAGALESLGLARRLSAESLEAILASAYVLRRQGAWSDALEQLRHALTLDSGRFETVFALAATHQQLGEYDAATRYWRRATALAPSVAESYAQFALVPVLEAGDVDDAVHLLHMGAERADPVQIARSARRLAPMVARADSASASTMWLARADTDPRALLARAQVLQTWGSMGPALAVYDTLRTLLVDLGAEGTAVHAHEGWRDAYLAVAAAALGDHDEAEKLALRAAKRLSVDRDAYIGPEWAILLATTYTMTGSHEAAIAELRQVLSRPSMISPALLRLDPTWDPLRPYLSFERLTRDRPAGLVTASGS